LIGGGGRGVFMNAFRSGGAATTTTRPSASGIEPLTSALHMSVRHKSNAKCTRPIDVPVASPPFIANMIVERLPLLIPEMPKW
jgi:hypothetical protein